MLRRLLKINRSPKNNTLVITITGQTKPDEEIFLSGYEVYPLKIKGVFTLFVGLWNLFIKIRKFKPDIIQTWLYHSDLIGGIIGRIAGVSAIVWNIRCEALSVQRARRKTMLVFELCKFLSYIIPAKIVCVGERVKESHIQAGFNKSKMHVIFNGYDVEKFKFSQESREKFREEFGAKEGEVLIGCVGRFHQDKGQDILIRVALKILRDTPNVKFAFIGRGCSYENSEIKHFQIEEKFKNNILMVGEKKDVTELLSAFDLYCMPSRSEGFPNSLAEAMLSEIPCVATNVGDTATLAGGVLSLADPKNPDALETKLRELIKLSDEERGFIGRKAREQVISNFSLEKASSNFDSLYKEIMRL